MEKNSVFFYFFKIILFLPKLIILIFSIGTVNLFDEPPEILKVVEQKGMFEKESKESKEIKKKGKEKLYEFPNSEGTCYFNAAMQMFMGSFCSKMVLKGKWDKVKQPLCYHLQEILLRVYSGKKMTISEMMSITREILRILGIPRVKGGSAINVYLRVVKGVGGETTKFSFENPTSIPEDKVNGRLFETAQTADRLFTVKVETGLPLVFDVGQKFDNMTSEDDAVLGRKTLTTRQHDLPFFPLIGQKPYHLTAVTLDIPLVNVVIKTRDGGYLELREHGWAFFRDLEARHNDGFILFTHERALELYGDEISQHNLDGPYTYKKHPTFGWQKYNKRGELSLQLPLNYPLETGHSMCLKKCSGSWFIVDDDRITLTTHERARQLINCYGTLVQFTPYETSKDKIKPFSETASADEPYQSPMESVKTKSLAVSQEKK